MAKRSKLPKGYFWRGPYIWIRTDPVTGKQASTELQDPKGIKEWRRKRENEAADPRNAAALKATLGQWVTEIIEIKQVDKSPSTIEIYRQKLGHFVRIWGADMPLLHITPVACDAYTKKRRTEASDHTITKEFSALSQMLKAARRAGCYPHDIAALRPLNVAPRYVPRVRHLSWDELERLQPECSLTLWAIVAVSVATSARLSEALKFERNDLVGWVAHLRGTKTEESDRYVPVLERFRPLLTELVLMRLPIGAEPNNLRRDLAKACKRAGIPVCTPNDLRRTHASLLLAGGATNDSTRRMLGHKTTRMVDMVYGQIDPKELENLIEGSSIGRTRLLGGATKTATIIDAPGEEVTNQPDSGANSEGRTRDLRFTKPNPDSRESEHLAEKQADEHTSTLSETQRDTGTSATRTATVTLDDALDCLRSLYDEVTGRFRYEPDDPVARALYRAERLLVRAQEVAEEPVVTRTGAYDYGDGTFGWARPWVAS